MSNLIQSLLESANPYQDQLGVSQRLSKKWAKSGLLEGLKDYDRNNMAVILENQAKQLVMEESSTGGNVTNGATFASGCIGQTTGVSFSNYVSVLAQAGVNFILLKDIGNTGITTDLLVAAPKVCNYCSLYSLFGIDHS